MKTQILNYSFNKLTKQITFTDINPIRLDSILLITDVTANIIIYNFADPLKGGTVATNVLTLTYDTSALNNTDKLQIFYDDSTAKLLTMPDLPSGAATAAKQLPDNHQVTVSNPPNLSGLATSSNQQPPSTTPTVYNVTLTNANTEYSQLLPDNTKQVFFKCRTLYDVRYAWVTGKVATPTAPYRICSAGMSISIDHLDFDTKTLYLASAQAGVIIEIEAHI